MLATWQEGQGVTPGGRRHENWTVALNIETTKSFH